MLNKQEKTTGAFFASLFLMLKDENDAVCEMSRSYGTLLAMIDLKQVKT